MPSRPLLATLLSFHLAAAGALLLPAPAHACSCALNNTDYLAPADGATEVPTNTRIWVGGAHFGDDSPTVEDLESSPPFLLLQDDGTEIELSAGVLSESSLSIAVFTPTAELVAGGVYSLVKEIYNLDSPEPTLVSLTTFSVGGAADLEAPALPRELARSSSSSARLPGQMSSCGPTDVVNISVEETGHLLVAQLGETGDFDTDNLNGVVSDLSPDGVFRLGVGSCRWSWPEAAPGASADAQWGALDLAGNFSGWSEATEIVIPPAGCSCSAQGNSTPAGLAALLAFMLLASAGRRRRT